MKKTKKMMKMEYNNPNSKKDILLKLFKMIWIPICIGIASIVLFFSFLPLNNNLKKRFITPYKDSVTLQSPDLYVVSTYYANNETSIKFIQTLNKLEKDYKIPYYLVNVSTYPDVLNAWEVKYFPTYFVFERAENSKSAVLVYKSYGNKESTALAKEINNVRKYGMPISNIGGTLSIMDENNANILDLTLVSVKPSENDINQFTVEFYVENKTKKQLTLNYSDFIVSSNTWTSSSEKAEAINKCNSKQLKLDGNKKENILIDYSGSFPYNQIDIRYKASDESNKQYKWTYKVWPAED